MRVRAAILKQSGLSYPYAQSKPLHIETITLAPPGPDEVLVRIAAAGLCHSDLSVINGDRPRPTPLALGHEASAIVEECGSHVTDLKRGDHVVMSFVPTCGHCAMCIDGRAALCEPGNLANGQGRLLSGASRITCDDGVVNHHCGVCAVSEYSVVSRRSIVKISEDIPLTHAALFGCAVMTGVGAVMNTCDVRAGQSVAVIGLGGVGLSAILGAVACGASKVVAVDLDDRKLQFAQTLGATHVFNAQDPDCVQQIRDVTGGGVDAAIELAGSVKAFENAFAMTRRGGISATGGLPHPESRVSLPAVMMVAEERQVRGSYMGSCVPSRDIPHYIELYRSGRLPVQSLMTSTGPLDTINEHFDLLHRGDVVRHVIDMLNG